MTAITAHPVGCPSNRSPRYTRPACRLRRRYAHAARVPFYEGDAPLSHASGGRRAVFIWAWNFAAQDRRPAKLASSTEV